MKTLTLLFSLLGAVTSFAAEPVSAVPTPAMEAGKPMDTMDKALINKPVGEPCKADREKFCKDVKPGEGALLRCMKSHKDELSADCKAKGEWMKTQFAEKMKDVRDACLSDVNKLCKDVKGGPHEKMHCLHEHEADLSAECKAAIPAHLHEKK